MSNGIIPKIEKQIMPKSTRSGKTGTTKPKTNKPRVKKEQPRGTPEYLDYLQRYEEMGEGRQRLSPEEFDQLDDELLELLDLAASGTELSDEQNIRIQELEFLLIDSE